MISSVLCQTPRQVITHGTSNLLTMTHVQVFARTAPEQKELILQTLREKSGLTTLMCGDGTNDVGALKAAHVGIALLAPRELKPKEEGSAPGAEASTSAPAGAVFEPLIHAMCQSPALSHTAALLYMSTLLDFDLR